MRALSTLVWIGREGSISSALRRQVAGRRSILNGSRHACRPPRSRGPRCDHPGEERGYEETRPCTPDLADALALTFASRWLAGNSPASPANQISVRPLPSGLDRTAVKRTGVLLLTLAEALVLFAATDRHRLTRRCFGRRKRNRDRAFGW
jgi:hypothetical protein